MTYLEDLRSQAWPGSRHWLVAHSGRHGHHLVGWVIQALNAWIHPRNTTWLHPRNHSLTRWRYLTMPVGVKGEGLASRRPLLRSRMVRLLLMTLMVLLWLSTTGTKSTCIPLAPSPVQRGWSEQKLHVRCHFGGKNSNVYL